MSLSKLIQAVEAGSRDNDFWSAVHVIPAMHITDVTLARDGSLDAAKRLHDALLPGWFPGLSQNVHTGFWFAWVQTKRDHHFAATGDDPARCWLLAILRALEQEGRDE